MAVLSHYHCHFMLALGLVLVLTSPMHLSTQLNIPVTYPSLFLSYSPQRHMGIMFVIYTYNPFNKLKVLNCFQNCTQTPVP